MDISIIIFYISTLFYLVSGIFFLLCNLDPKSLKNLRIADRLFLSGVILHAGTIIVRFIIYGYFPVVSLYETLVFISLVIGIRFLLFRLKHKFRNLGTLFISIILFINFSTLVLNTEAGVAPSLENIWLNVWLMTHVPLGLGSYGAFVVSVVFGIIYLTKYFKNSKDRLQLYYEITFKLIKVGFVLLSFCIVTGSIWAYFAWGSFWGWDPKETWSLITWILYLITLLFFYFNKNRKLLNVFISLISFISVIFTYLGVNLLIVGLHSYI